MVNAEYNHGRTAKNTAGNLYKGRQCWRAENAVYRIVLIIKLQSNVSPGELSMLLSLVLIMLNCDRSEEYFN